MGLQIINIEEKLHTWSSSDLEGSLDSIIDKLTEKKKELSRTHTDLRIDLETEYGYYDEQWQNLTVYGKRKMTVKEFVKGKKQCVTVK